MPAATPQIRRARDRTYEALILDTAEAQFARTGVDACQMKDVAREAGISLATQYRYFPSKTALLRAVHARRLDALLERVDGAVRRAAGPLSGLLRANEAYLRFHMDHPDYLGMHLREGNAWFESDRLRCPEQIEALERGLDRAAAAFAAGIEAGLFVDDSPRWMALASVAANQVHLSHWVTTGRTERPATVVRRAHGHFIRACPTGRKIPELLTGLAP